MPIAEDLLHFIWQFRLYRSKDLITTDGDPVTVIDPGRHNLNAGPDFEFARLRIGDTLWSGHIEIHVNAKDWHQHQHHLDPAYDSTVLHVVWQHDHAARRSDGTHIVTVELQHCVDPTTIERYQRLMQNLNWIPCEKQLSEVSNFTKESWLERMAIERLESRFNYISTLLDKSKNHWEKVLLLMLGRAFGMKVNAQAFEHLLQNIDFALLLKYQNQPKQLEALLYGVSGLLPSDAADSYLTELNSEFAYLQKKHSLDTIAPTEWKFHRMRPYNFPTFRLAQLCALYQQEVYWFSSILEADNLHRIRRRLADIEANTYWETHFRFGATSSSHSTALSDPFINHLVINCFAPILFAYGKFVDNATYKTKAIEWLTEASKEVNAITKKFALLGMPHKDAGNSQALLHLKNAYCDMKKCLQCAIGLSILKTVPRQTE